jgi:hypothetical protein
MDTQKRFLLPERNPKTHAEHRREVFWQITLPLAIGLLLLLAAVAAIIFSATQPVTDLERWSDVSLMWMIVPSLFFALIILIVLIGFVYAITFILKIVPRYARVVQLYFELGKGKLSRLSNLSVEPILRVRSIWAVLRLAGRQGDKTTKEDELG